MSRIETLQSRLTTDAYLVENPVDLLYFTGLDLSSGSLIVRRDEATLYVDGRYIEEATSRSPCSVALIESFTCRGMKLAFDGNYTSYNRFTALHKLGAELIVDTTSIREMRMVKESGEIERLRSSAALAVRGYERVLQLLHEGVSEEEIAIELEVFWRKVGGERLSFDPIIAFGENSSKPHYRPSKRELKQGDTVLIDIGVRLDRYHSDMTRVHYFGHPPSELESIYHIVRKAQQEALALCRPGIEMRELDRAARGVIESAGYGKQFMHSLGHGIGLEIHEPPRLAQRGTEGELTAGMVMTIEPGIYLPGLGGVRLEDTIVITESGYDNLTNRPIGEALPLL